MVFKSVIGVACTCLADVSLSAQADDRLYDLTLPGCTYTFSNINCWIGGVVQDTGDNAIYNTSALTPYTINFTGNTPSHNDALIRADNLIWNLGGFTYAICTMDIARLSVVSASTVPVPVPAAVWLFASGLPGLLGVAKRKKNMLQ